MVGADGAAAEFFKSAKSASAAACEWGGRMRIAVMSDLHLEFDARSAAASGHASRDHAGRDDNGRGYDGRDDASRDDNGRGYDGRDDASRLDFYHQPPQPAADLVIFAGDIHNGATAVDWILNHFSIPAILICGNHEAYRHELFRVIAYNRQRAAQTGGRVVFLERATWNYESPAGERARFIGATLWTDFQLGGTPAVSMAAAQQQLEDFREIRVERGYRLRPLRRPTRSACLMPASRCCIAS
jgi:hypothetical protein